MGCARIAGDCLEGVSVRTRARRARWGSPAQDIGVEDERHAAMWQLEAEYLAVALHAFVCTVSPQRIVVGGGVGQQEFLLGPGSGCCRCPWRATSTKPRSCLTFDSYVVPPLLGINPAASGRSSSHSPRRTDGPGSTPGQSGIGRPLRPGGSRVTAPLVVEPVFAERLWGGTTLQSWYGAKVPDAVIGEAWAVSGLPGMSGVISSGAPAGYTLARAWSEGLVTGSVRDDDFPLLCKLLDPADWLSVQVHPDDEQAQRLEDEPRGKAECWYVLDAVPGAELVMGHRRPTASALAADLAAGDLMDQLITHPVRPGSFFMVPAGCVHAVGPGSWSTKSNRVVTSPTGCTTSTASAPTGRPATCMWTRGSLSCRHRLIPRPP